MLAVNIDCYTDDMFLLATARITTLSWQYMAVWQSGSPHVNLVWYGNILFDIMYNNIL